MKKWIFLLLCIAATVAGKAQSNIVDSPTLRLRINLDIVPNNNGSITATKLNNLLNGALNVEGNLLKTKVDSVWVVGRNIYVRKGSNTYNYLLTAVYDSTVNNLVNYYTKTAADARYQPLEDQRLSVANNVEFAGVNASALSLRSQNTLYKHTFVARGLTNFRFDTLRDKSGTVAYLNDTLTGQFATKTDLEPLATASSVNAALALKENSITPSNTVGRYWNGYKNFVQLLSDSITEGSKLFYTDSRARQAISLTTTGSGAATYNNSTGVLNVPTNSGGGVTVGTYATRVAIASPSVGQQFYQTDIFQGLYTFNGRTWERDRTGVINDCDFLNFNDLGMNGLGGSGSGTGAGYNFGATNGTAQNTTGIVSIATGTTTTGYYRIMYGSLNAGGNTSYGFNQYSTYIRTFRVLFPTLADGTESFSARFGCDNNVNGNTNTYGVNFLYSNSNSNWQMQYTNSGGNFTTAASSISVVANTWYELSIVAYSTSPTTNNYWNVDFYINNSLVGSYLQSSGIESILGVSPLFSGIYKTAGTTSRNVWIDFMKFYKIR